MSIFLDAAEVNQIAPQAVYGLDRNALGTVNPLQYPANRDNIYSSIEYANGAAINSQPGGKLENSITGSDLYWIGDVTDFADSSFGTVFGVINGFRETKKLQAFPRLKLFSNLLTVVSVATQIGFSYYDNFVVDNGYSKERKWGNFVGDMVYTGLSIGLAFGAKALLGPVFGPIGAVVAGFLFDLLWKGEWNMFGWHVEGLKIEGRTIDYYVKEWLTKLFGG